MKAHGAIRYWMAHHSIPIPFNIGIAFQYKGDEVYWIWPWKRNKNHKWYSVGFAGRFATLTDLDNEWEAYHQAVIKLARKAAT